MPQPFHLIYRPAGTSCQTDRIISLLRTSDPTDVTLHLHAAPDAVAMQLESETEDELPCELSDLGFQRNR